jgi:hypothetical protein
MMKYVRRMAVIEFDEITEDDDEPPTPAVSADGLFTPQGMEKELNQMFLDHRWYSNFSVTMLVNQGERTE